MILLAMTSAICPATGVTTYIRAGKVFDGTALLEQKVIVVRDGRIAEIGDWSLPVPETDQLIDARDQTVLPGFIDSHLHFEATPLPYVDKIERFGTGRLAAEAMSLFPEHRRTLLRNGVTALIDMGAPNAGYLGMRRALEKAKVIGPELFFPGPLITAPGGHPAGTTYVGQHDLIDNGTIQVNDTAVIQRKVRELARLGVDFIKVVYDRMWYRKGGAPRLGLEVARTTIREAHRLGLKVFAHVGSEEEAQDMVDAGADGIEHGFASKSDALFQEMAAKGIFFTPTICAYLHYAPAGVLSMKQTLERACELGVPLAVGTDFPASYGEHCGDDIYQEMAMWEEVGIPRLAVLKGATSNAAAKIGKDREIGRIAPGQRANLVFMNGAIDTGRLSSGRIAKVMLHGEIVIEEGRVPARYSRKFRENSTMFFGYPYWDPLLSFLVGGSVTEFDLFRTGTTASADVLFSVRNMWAANLALALPSPIPRTRLKAGFHFDNQNRLFYGIGNDSKLADPVEYEALVFKEGFEGLTRLAWGWNLRTALAFDQSQFRPFRQDTLPAAIRRASGRQALVGLSLIHDRRDHENNPWYGSYFAVGGQTSIPGLSSHAFQRFSHDLRVYASPFHRHIIAARLFFQLTFDDAPFYYYPDFGGDTLGRGYLPNRYRDRAGFYLQGEYRFPVWSFISGAAFAEVGQFRTSLGRLRLDGFHPAFGFGPRFSFGPNENSMLGIDVGFTPEGWNLVLHNGQAF